MDLARPVAGGLDLLSPRKFGWSRCVGIVAPAGGQGLHRSPPDVPVLVGGGALTQEGQRGGIVALAGSQSLHRNPVGA